MAPDTSVFKVAPSVLNRQHLLQQQEMSGVGGGGPSKAAKKNAKRHAKKQAAALKQSSAPSKGKAPKSLDPADLLPILKEQLAKAKADKDIPAAGEIREQIWVLTDVIAGVKTDMPESELNPILAKIEALLGTKEKEREKHAVEAPASVDPEKRIRNLRKKLDQIQKLKDRQANGENLEEGQLEKIKSEEKTQDEINELERLTIE